MRVRRRSTRRAAGRWKRSWRSNLPETTALYERIRVGDELGTAGAGARLHTLRELLHTAFLHRTEAGCFEVHEQLRQYGAWQWQHALECGRVVQIREFLGQSIGGIHQPHYSMG